MKEKMRRALMIFLAAVIIFCGYNLVNIFLDYKKGEDFYESAREEFYAEAEPEEMAESGEKYITASTGEGESIPLEKLIDFEKLKETNEDIEGWIRIEDTNIDYPVLKSKKSNNDYIYTAYDGSYSGFGSVFVDYRNSSDFADSNTIFYAHNMRDGSMFNNIVKYKNSDFANEHKTIRLLTKDGEQRYEVYSAYKTLANSQSYTYSFESERDFESFIDMTNKNSIIDMENAAGYNDKIITLSTCTDTGRTANRFVLHAKLIK